MSTKNVRNRWFAIAISLIMICLVGLTACTKDTTSQSSTDVSTLGQIATSNKIKVGYIVFPPAIVKNPTTNELSGHFVDTIKEIARLNKWEIDFVETDWAGFATGLNSKRFDVSIAPTFVTVPRALAVYFTRPLMYVGNSAIVRTNETRFANIESADQPEITIAVTQGEAGDEYVKANFKKAKITRFSGGDQSLAFQAVVSGRADIALGDAYVTSQFTKANQAKVKDLFADAPYNLTPVSWAVRRGDDETLNFINNSLDAFDYQGRLIEWEKKAGANWLHLKKIWELTSK